MRRLGEGAATALLLAAAAITFGDWHVPLPPPATTHTVLDIPEHLIAPPPSPLTGAFQPNTLLRDRAVHLFDSVLGSESVAPGPGPSSVTMLDRYGYVWVADAAPGEEGSPRSSGYALRPTPTAYLGPGRPLGFRYDGEGNLIVCDSLKGLIMLEASTGRVIILSSHVTDAPPGSPGALITYANDLDIAPDGTIYFTDCQNITTAPHAGGLGYYDTFWSFLLGLYSGTPSGRLLAYDSTTGRTRVVAEGFWYANGVAVSADGQFVAVVETNVWRVRRVWVAGPRAGLVDTLIDALPAFPDGISTAPDGGFWLALVAPRPPIYKLLRYKLARSIVPWLPEREGLTPVPPRPHIYKLLRYKLARSIVPWLSAALRPTAKLQGLVVRLSPDGTPQHSMWDTQGEVVASVSAAEEHAGRLWLGNLRGSGVSYVDV
ncbi:hypothetical protein FOA52_014968 [Chlamydomonas sp. UWO 241]|nr:hypothetical protein FOA52_014968 [Chlamydomonas sp. UWO 241]